MKYIIHYNFLQFSTNSFIISRGSFEQEIIFKYSGIIINEVQTKLGDKINPTQHFCWHCCFHQVLMWVRDNPAGVKKRFSFFRFVIWYLFRHLRFDCLLATWFVNFKTNTDVLLSSLSGSFRFIEAFAMWGRTDFKFI